MSVRTAGFVFCALLLAACAGHSGGFTPMAPNSAASSRHVEPARDLGRRAAGKTASVVLLLKYRDQAGLDRFTAQLARSRSPRYLTHQEFLAHYAPTPQQEQRVIDALHRAGFTINARYANRTIVDATAPVRDVERFFDTQIHDFRQARHGVRFASVRPAVIPSRLASLVSSVTIDTVVRMHVASDFDTPPALPDTMPVPDEVAPAEPETATGNIIKNPGFETGHLKPWQALLEQGRRRGSHLEDRALRQTRRFDRFDECAGSCGHLLRVATGDDPRASAAHRVYSAQHGRHESLESRPVRSAVRREGQVRRDALQLARLIEALVEADDASGAVRRPAALRYVRRNRSEERCEKIRRDVDRRRLADRRCFDAHAVAIPVADSDADRGDRFALSDRGAADAQLRA